MMSDNDDRIKLALAQGWKYEFESHWGCAQDGEGLLGYICNWTSPKGKKYRGDHYSRNKRKTIPPFKPFTNVNDSEALKQWIQSQGWWIEIEWQAKTIEVQSPGIWVHVWNPITEEHIREECCDDEKHAIARAALKVIGEKS
jgi:hypothetical protein